MKPIYYCEHNYKVVFPTRKERILAICLLWPKGSSGTQTGPELTEAWGPDTMDLIYDSRSL